MNDDLKSTLTASMKDGGGVSGCEVWRYSSRKTDLYCGREGV